ncbi:MAG: methionine synthase, partial [Actinobacteria bacterium]|nr:methionine synthase [Actinomycetota bacterium]
MSQRIRAHAAATGIGSLPLGLATKGRVTDPRETARIVSDVFPELPHMVELPGRGAGADMVGRTAAMLGLVSADFAVHTVPSGWRRTSRPGVDVERASRWLDEDFDALAEVCAEYRGPFKIQMCGPLTWCRVVEDIAGEPALRDAGFVSDVVAGIGEAAKLQVARLRRLVPAVTEVVVQIDEPALAQVMTGAVKTASGRGRIAPPDEQHTRAWLTHIVEGIRAA